MDSEVRPTAAIERIEILDVLRGLAVGGILIGNMQWFSGYGMMPPALAASTPLADQVTHFLVHFFIEGKFYSIFSFLFGFGFALQIARAEQRGDTKATLFKRRLFWLLVIGLLHGLLLWAGDILSVYALMGFVLLLFRKKTDEQLLKWAFWLMIVPVVTYILLLAAFLAFLVLAPPAVSGRIDATIAAQWTRNVQTVSQGSYWQIFSEYNLPSIIGRYIGLIVQMRVPKILVMFLLGLYAYRRGVFHDPVGHAPFIRKVLVYGLILGLIGNLVMAASSGNEAAFPPSVSGFVGVIGYSFGVPALALGIIATVTTLWQSPASHKVLAILAPVGRMGVTNYLVQTVICITIFYGYGFGAFGKYGATHATLIALAIFVFQIVLSGVWLKFFAYGPMEWIWRQLTYRKRLNLRRAT